MTPDGPIASTELARRAVDVRELRSSQSPSGSVSRSGHSASARRWASAGETRCRVDARGGTGFPETMSEMRMVTGPVDPPPSGSITQKPSPHERQVPRMSVIAGPPLGPVSPRSTRRTTTRRPTTWGPKVWALAWEDTPGY